jgi:uncharacterized membrane protein YfcA
MEIIGYALSLLIGMSLGLIGGGGSILTLPVLVYIFKIDPVAATTYSLFIVGLSSAAGMYSKMKGNLVDYRTALVFGLPSLLTVLITRKLLLPHIPELFVIREFQISKSSAMLIVFSGLMILASVSMIKNKITESVKSYNPSNLKLALQGVSVGILTGLLGAGGGFIIIPALVVLSGIPMKVAVGTSLLIITVNSLLGLTVDLVNHTHQINWKVLSYVTALSILGTFIGSLICVRINPSKLKKGFGWFVLIMGFYILISQMLPSFSNSLTNFV